LLDNRDDIIRGAKKMREKLSASLEDARTRLAELETHNLDARLEIDSLKASPVVSDEAECADCPMFLADLAMFKEKHAFKCEELDCHTRFSVENQMHLICAPGSSLHI
jgi:hypothetical protein